MAWEATPWGYDVDGELPPIIDAGTFDEMTAHAYNVDDKVLAAVLGAGASVRDHCGWHVCGPMACRAAIDGGERAVWLPSAHVTAVTSVTVLGEDVTDACEWSRRGELRLPHSPDRLGAVVVEFTSGLPTAPGSLASLVASVAARGVALPYGVQQETAGSVSVSYLAGAAALAGRVTLTDEDRAALSAWRLWEAR